MSVVINEFEVVPAEPRPPAQAQPAAEAPPPDLRREIERAVEERRDRDLRLRAD